MATSYGPGDKLSRGADTLAGKAYFPTSQPRNEIMVVIFAFRKRIFGARQDLIK